MWTAVLTAAYGLTLPHLYQEGRYLMPVLPFLVLLCVKGVQMIARWAGGQIPVLAREVWRKPLTALLLVGVLLSSSFGFLSQADTFAALTQYIGQRQVRTARWIAQNLPADAVVGTHDIGAIGYYSGRRVVDMVGLVSPGMIRHIGDFDGLGRFLASQGVTHLAVLRNWFEVSSQTPLFTTGEEAPEIMEVFAYVPHRTRFILQEVSHAEMAAAGMLAAGRGAEAAALMERAAQVEPACARVRFLAGLAEASARPRRSRCVVVPGGPPAATRSPGGEDRTRGTPEVPGDHEGFIDNAGAAVMMGRKGIVFVALGFMVILLLSGAAVIGWMAFGPNTFEEPAVRMLYVSRGEPFSRIVDSLAASGIIRSRRAFVLTAKLFGGSSAIKVGKYVLRSGVSNHRIMAMLVSGRDAEAIRVLVPPGTTARVQARLFARELGCDSARIMTLFADRSFGASLGVDAPTLEGYLLPETYDFEWNQDEEYVLRSMVEQFHRFYTDSLRAREKELGWTTRQVLTMASIIQGESRLPEELRIISGVYHNRLRKRMPMQADPTIQYIIPDGPRRLYYEDLRIDDPYNTYRYAGLPPGPVNSPGREAILAALFPQSNAYLYFVANGQGGHRFAGSYEAHLRNVRLYRRHRAVSGVGIRHAGEITMAAGNHLLTTTHHGRVSHQQHMTPTAICTSTGHNTSGGSGVPGLQESRSGRSGWGGQDGRDGQWNGRIGPLAGFQGFSHAVAAGALAAGIHHRRVCGPGPASGRSAGQRRAPGHPLVPRH